MSETNQVVVYPDYSGEDPTCPKCQRSGASSKYMQYGRCSHYNGETFVIGVEENERIHRECLNCGYAWDEAART